MMPTIVVAGDHRREQEVAAGAAEELRDGDRHRLARGENLLDRRLVEDRVGGGGISSSNVKSCWTLSFSSSEKTKPTVGIEHGDGAMHQLLEQLPFRPQRVQRAADVVERLELEELAAELEVRWLGP